MREIDESDRNSVLVQGATLSLVHYASADESSQSEGEVDEVDQQRDMELDESEDAGEVDEIEEEGSNFSDEICEQFSDRVDVHQEDDEDEEHKQENAFAEEERKTNFMRSNKQRAKQHPHYRSGMNSA